MTSHPHGLRSILLLVAFGYSLGASASAQTFRVTPGADVRRAPPARGETAFTFTQAPTGVVQVMSWEPGTRLPIATSGGTAPVTYKVTSASPELFEIAELPALTGGAPRSASGTSAGLPAGGIVLPRALRFKGLSSQGWGAGRDLPVTLTATDASGRSISREFTLMAIPGRISSLQVVGNVVRAQNTRITATVDLLPPGASVQVEGSTDWVSSAPRGITRHPCNFSANFGAAETGPTSIADAAGKITLSLPGTFYAKDTEKTGPCALGLKLNVTPRGAAKATRVWVLATTATVRLQAPVTYRVDRTWSLNSKFRFAVHPPLPGSCIGASAFTGGVFPIGAFEDDNGDLALAVRSGPLGTDCKAQSGPWLLQDGFTLVSIDWDVQRTGSKCCLGDACRPSSAAASAGLIVPGAIPSEDPEVYETASREDPFRDETKLSAGANPARQIRRVFNSTEARLACKETSSNDHGVKVTLKSVTFEGPPGKTFP